MIFPRNTIKIIFNKFDKHESEYQVSLSQLFSKDRDHYFRNITAVT